jgi:hypothetical protein
MLERICNIPVKTWLDLISDLNEDVTEGKPMDRGEMDEDSVEEPLPPPFCPSSPPHKLESHSCLMEESCLEAGLPTRVTWEDTPLPDVPTSKCNELGWCWIGGLIGEGEDCILATRQALRKLNSRYLWVPILLKIVTHLMLNIRCKIINIYPAHILLCVTITVTRKDRLIQVTCIQTQ